MLFMDKIIESLMKLLRFLNDVLFLFSELDNSHVSVPLHEGSQEVMPVRLLLIHNNNIWAASLYSV